MRYALCLGAMLAGLLLGGSIGIASMPASYIYAPLPPTLAQDEDQMCARIAREALGYECIGDPAVLASTPETEDVYQQVVVLFAVSVPGGGRAWVAEQLLYEGGVRVR